MPPDPDLLEGNARKKSAGRVAALHSGTLDSCVATSPPYVRTDSRARPIMPTDASSIGRVHSGLPDGCTRFDLIRLVNAVCRIEFELSSSAVRYLVHSINGCRDEDFLPGRLCGIWQRPETIAAAIGVTPRTISAAEKQLQEARLIIRTGYPRSQRNGTRTRSGIQRLVGISLAPLVDLAKTLIAKEQAQTSRQDAVEQLRSEIADLRAAIRRSGDCRSCDEAEKILPRGRTSRITNLAKLAEIRSALETVLQTISGRAGAEETSDRSEKTTSPYILHQDSKESCSPAASATDHPISFTPAQVADLASDDYRALLDARGGPTWSNMIEVSVITTGWHGIPQRHWAVACRVLGRELAAVCMLIIDRNSRLPEGHRYRGRIPRACLVGMVRKHRQQRFEPARLLMAMQAFGTDTARSAASPLGNRAPAPLPGVSHFGSQLEGIIQQATRQLTGAIQ